MKWERQRYSSLLGDGPHDCGLYALADDDFINDSVALQVPGCLHILHNASRDLADGLPNMVSVQVGMKAVSKLLSTKFYLDALLATGFS